MMILVLKGGRNKGKTSAIRKAYDLRLEMGKKHNIINNVISVNPSTTRGLPKKDLAATLELTCKIKIAFYSAGDEAKHIKAAFNYAKSKNADILIMAARPRMRILEIAGCENQDTYTVFELKPADLLLDKVNRDVVVKNCCVSWLSGNCINLAELNALNILITLKHIIVKIKAECTLEFFI